MMIKQWWLFGEKTISAGLNLASSLLWVKNIHRACHWLNTRLTTVIMSGKASVVLCSSTWQNSRYLSTRSSWNKLGWCHLRCLYLWLVCSLDVLKLARRLFLKLLPHVWCWWWGRSSPSFDGLSIWFPGSVLVWWHVHLRWLPLVSAPSMRSIKGSSFFEEKISLN